MLDKYTKSALIEIFTSYPEIIAVYLFGSYLERKENAQDVDLAFLLEQPVKSQVDIYMILYSQLTQVLAPLAEPFIPALLTLAGAL